MAGRTRSLRGLLEACHPLPSVAVTAFGTGYGLLAAGLAWPTGLLLALALLTGQLSIGWCNDYVDALRDTAAGREDKPVAAGAVGRRTVGLAALAAASACVIASLSLGPLPGALHLVAVASAWTYNVWLKTTPLSPAPYAVSFALLPAIATTAGSPAGWPDPLVMVAAAGLGVAAHFANTVGDAEADAATGVNGLPQRIGPRASMVTMAVLVVFSAVVLLVGGTRTTVTGRIGAGVLAAGAQLGVVAAAVAVARGAGRGAFRLTLVAVALVVGGFLASGPPDGPG